MGKNTTDIAVVKTQMIAINKNQEELKILMKESFEASDKRTDRIIESFNGKNKMTDDRITAVDKKHQKQADNHCRDLKIVKKEQEGIKVKLATTTTKLAFIISGIIFAVVFFFDRIATYIDNLFFRYH